jgi:hypothetical protein
VSEADGRDPQDPPRDPYAPPADPRVPPRDPQRTPPPRRAPRRGATRLSPPERRPDRPPGGGPAVDAGGRRGFLLAAGGLFLTVLSFPAAYAAPLGLVLAVVGAVVGLRARRRAATAGTTAPGATAAVVLGLLTAALAAILALGLLFFFDEVTRYRECMLGANTQVAQNNCEQQLRDSVEERTGFSG